MYEWIAIWWTFWYSIFLVWINGEIESGNRPVPTKMALFFGFVFAGFVPVIALIVTIRDAFR